MDRRLENIMNADVGKNSVNALEKTPEVSNVYKINGEEGNGNEPKGFTCL
jgi:hypothetical protein